MPITQASQSCAFRDRRQLQHLIGNRRPLQLTKNGGAGRVFGFVGKIGCLQGSLYGSSLSLQGTASASGDWRRGIVLLFSKILSAALLSIASSVRCRTQPRYFRERLLTNRLNSFKQRPCSLANFFTVGPSHFFSPVFVFTRTVVKRSRCFSARFAVLHHPLRRPRIPAAKVRADEAQKPEISQNCLMVSV